MAVISKETVLVGGLEFVREIRVLKDGLFRIRLPIYVTAKFGIEEVSAETKEEAVAEFKKLAQDYERARTTEKRVILYKIRFRGSIFGPAKLDEDFDPEGDLDPEDEICLFREEDFHFEGGMIVGIQAGVFIEERIEKEDGTVVFRYEEVDREENLPSGLRDGDLVPYGMQEAKNKLDWTTRRHEFFESLYKAMAKLIWKVKDLRDGDKLEEIADKGTKLIED